MPWFRNFYILSLFYCALALQSLLHLVVFCKACARLWASWSSWGPCGGCLDPLRRRLVLAQWRTRFYQEAPDILFLCSQRRNRTCLGHDCIGTFVEYEPCALDCPGTVWCSFPSKCVGFSVPGESVVFIRMYSRFDCVQQPCAFFYPVLVDLCLLILRSTGISNRKFRIV